MSQMTDPHEGKIAALKAFAEQAATTLRDEERARILWLTGSLATGMADAQSDVDLRVAVQPEDFASVGQWWQNLIDRISTTVWKRRWPGAPDEVILSAITPDYLRFDVVIQSVADRKPRTLEAAQVLFDKDGLAEQFTLTAPMPQQPLARLSFVVEEGIRLLGMLPIVVERDDVPMGIEGQLAMHSLLISLLLMENGIDRVSMGKRHIVAFLNEEQRAVLGQVPSLAPTMTSVIAGRAAYGRIFLPRARHLMEANGLVYPEAFEATTKRSLWETLGLSL